MNYWGRLQWIQKRIIGLKWIKDQYCSHRETTYLLNYFKSRFTPHKTEQLLQGNGITRKSKRLRGTACRKVDQKRHKDNRYLANPELQSFRSYKFQNYKKNSIGLYMPVSMKKDILPERYIWDKIFNNGLSKTYGRQPLKNLKGYGLFQAHHTPLIFFKGRFPKITLGPRLNTLAHMFEIFGESV